MLVTIHMGLSGYGNEWEEDVEVTDSEYKRMKDALSNGRDFSDCHEIKDIYDRIRDIADESATESFQFDDSDIAERFKNDKNLKASDLFHICIECYEFSSDEE